MSDRWIVWADNEGGKVAARLDDVLAFISAPNQPPDSPKVGIKLGSGLISWLDTTFEDVASCVINNDSCVNGVVIQTRPRVSAEAVEATPTPTEQESYPDQEAKIGF